MGRVYVLVSKNAFSAKTFIYKSSFWVSKKCFSEFYLILKARVSSFFVNGLKDPFRILKPPFSAYSCQIILNKVGSSHLRNTFVSKGTLLPIQQKTNKQRKN